jgi:hypothetical protein
VTVFPCWSSANGNPIIVQQIVQKFGDRVNPRHQEMIAGASPFSRYVVPIERQAGGDLHLFASKRAPVPFLGLFGTPC